MAAEVTAAGHGHVEVRLTWNYKYGKVDTRPITRYLAKESRESQEMNIGLKNFVAASTSKDCTFTLWYVVNSFCVIDSEELFL